MAYPVPSQASKVGTGSEVSVTIPDLCRYFTVKSVGGTFTYGYGAGLSAAGTPVANGEVRTFVTPDMANRLFYMTMSAAVTAYFDYYYDVENS